MQQMLCLDGDKGALAVDGCLILFPGLSPLPA